MARTGRSPTGGGASLEFLGGREKLQSFVVPSDLREELARARALETAAVRNMAGAVEATSSIAVNSPAMITSSSSSSRGAGTSKVGLTEALV